jgi:membrane-bound metal-dependent hydrolase YbcI (DUF457 family)
MPDYKGHLLGGAFFYFIVLALLAAQYFPVFTIIQWFLFTLAGSLFPDIDIKSKGQQLFYRVFFVIIVGCICYQSFLLATFLGLFALVPLLGKHRGIFHNLWFLLVITGCATKLLVFQFPHFYYTIVYNALFFAVGVISHLWLDMGFIRMLKFR